jgi:hypothetical protein
MHIELLERFEHLGFFLCWIGMALVLGFTLAYVWHSVHARLETENVRSVISKGELDHEIR